MRAINGTKTEHTDMLKRISKPRKKSFIFLSLSLIHWIRETIDKKRRIMDPPMGALEFSCSSSDWSGAANLIKPAMKIKTMRLIIIEAISVKHQKWLSELIFMPS